MVRWTWISEMNEFRMKLGLQYEQHVCIMLRMKRCLFLLPFLFLVSCERGVEAEPTDAQALYDKAQALLKPNVEHDASDFKGAWLCLQQAAKAGLMRAQLDVAGVYFAGGMGIPADFQQAYNWFSLAAAQGSKEAEVFLGILQYDGSLGKQDKAAAMKHWRTAAEAGIAEGQYRLGRLLAQQPESLQEGVDWLVKSSSFVPQAATALGNIYYKMLDDTATAAAWYEKGAMAGDPLAQHVFAEMLLLGDPVEKDSERGLAMLRMAAGQDYKPAMVRLVHVLRNGKNAGDNEKEAEAWAARLQELVKDEKAKPQK